MEVPNKNKFKLSNQVWTKQSNETRNSVKSCNLQQSQGVGVRLCEEEGRFKKKKKYADGGST